MEDSYVGKSAKRGDSLQQLDDATILAIESSCDETAAAVVRNGREVLSSIISSQVPIHTLYGGVVPEIASRKHIEAIGGVVDKAICDSKLSLEDIDAIAVTKGPGLVGALLVGVSFAKALSYATKTPLVGVHHIEGHISANYIEHPDLKPPFICLVVSGGHTNLVNVVDYGSCQIIGRTRDDAAGEAFDKIGRAIGLGYPGGPKIEKAAKTGSRTAIELPVAVVNDNPYDFSFSGLKSATLNYINKVKMRGEDVNVNDVAASFQDAVVTALVNHAAMALDEYGSDKMVLAGGVACNSYLRLKMDKMCAEKGADFFCPSPVLCTDNAAMIGAAGYYAYINGTRDSYDMDAVASLGIGD